MSKVLLGDYQSRTIFIGVYAESEADDRAVRAASIKRQLGAVGGIQHLYHQPAFDVNAQVERIAVVFESAEAKNSAEAQTRTIVQSEGGYVLKQKGISQLPQYYIKALNKVVQG